MSMFTKLLKYPHRAVFDTTPHGDAAFILNVGSFISWVIVDGLFSITLNYPFVYLDAEGVTETLLGTEGDVLFVVNPTPSFGGSVVFGEDETMTVTYDLAGITVQELIDLLVLDGFVIDYISPLFLPLSTSVLLDGNSATSVNVINGFTSLLWSLFGGYAVELKAAKLMITEAIKQMAITEAEGEWLELWGKLFSTVKLTGQTDVAYRSLIQSEVFRKRLNKYAIEEAILAHTGKVVTIEENFLSLFRLDESRLSSDSRFGDGVTVGAFIIRPVSSIVIDWVDVLEVINKNRAAGIIVLPPVVRFP